MFMFNWHGYCFLSGRTFQKEEKMKRFFVFVCVALLATSVFAQSAAETQSYPNHAIELAINGGAGGGSDVLARTLVDIIQTNNLVSQPFSLINKTGGGGAICFSYVNSRTDYDYTTTTINSANILTLNVTNAYGPLGHFTPIALVAMDNQCFVTLADGPFKTWADVESYMKANPGSLTIGCADDLDELAVVTLEGASGVKFNRTAYFSGSSEVVTALLGGHIAFAVLNPVECISLFESGRVNVVASFSAETLSAPFDKVPTFKDLGYDNCVVQMFRGIMGAAGMSSEAQHYLSDAILKAVKTDAWKTNYIDKNILEAKYMGCDEFAAYLEDYEKTLVEFAKANGMM